MIPAGKPLETVAARMALVGWGVARDGDALVAYRVSTSRHCTTLRDLEQLAIALEAHARGAARREASSEHP